MTAGCVLPPPGGRDRPAAAVVPAAERNASGEGDRWLLRSSALGAARGGMRWRGTFHANAELKAGRRHGQARKLLRERRPAA
jgi:hypothetical protein